MTKVSDTSLIARIKESAVDVTPHLENAVIPTISIVPVYQDNRTGSRTELDLAFHLPSLVESNDRLEIEGAQDLIIPTSSDPMQCTRVTQDD